MASIEPCNLAAGEEVRPLANFAPSMWGDIFSSLPIHDQAYKTCMDVEIQRLKEIVRAILVDISVDPSKKIEIIGCLHRLGLSYHFEAEIESQLETLFGNLYYEDDKEYDLHTISTQFRIFRQHGYKMSCHVFNKFIDHSGKFMDSLATDVRGMLSLYEASHLRVRGEDVLEEALAFTTTNLKRIALEAQIPSPVLINQVARALKQPFHMGIPRVEARVYISIYEDDHLESRNESILKLAKLDFNMQQQMHQQEVRLVQKWWNDMEFPEKLPYVRDRAVESYFFANTLCPMPQYSSARIIMAKVTLFITILDDTYDAFGTFKELHLFTQAIERWDMNAIDLLPNNIMKFIYTKLLTFYKEFHQETTGDARLCGVPDSIESVKETCRANYQQAKWLNDGYIPNLDHEYTDVAYVSVLIRLLVTSSIMGMSDIATKDAFEWLRGEPKIFKVTQVISRLQDDLSGREHDQQRAHNASAVECCMKQYGVSFEEAVREIRQRIVDGWKDSNEECLKPTSNVPLYIYKWFTDMIRFINTVYKDTDGFTHPETIKDDIRSVFVNPIPI